ncbi:hypothetical protein EXIGLDRAFT_780341 [Exidia glandulosa HHB12029]|uniref:Uncharacterized protein n=1 Tax=Exidia glandulosa HHB12029 TaxID=1314781 RepID=A0A165BN43_EXIGL|nr:hypothetical protein EXIGLDRAFT_780341 [Exidia glandulosa HHB12029]
MAGQDGMAASTSAATRLTREQATSESRKRKAIEDADREAERASEIRAIVRRVDNRHLQSAILPIDSTPTAQTHTDFHMANWSADSPPCVATALPDFEVQPRGVTLEDVFAYNKNASTWLDTLRAAARAPTANTGYACAVVMLDWRFEEGEVATKRSQAEEGIRRWLKQASFTLVAPQPLDNRKPGQPGPTGFLGTSVSLEGVNFAAAAYAVYIKWPECKEGVAVLIIRPDLEPPTHVASYENLPNLPTITPALEARFLEMFRAHVEKRWSEVDGFLATNKARIWGGGALEPNSLDLVQASMHIRVWEKKLDDGNTEVSISVYFLGVFDATWLHSVWEKTLMGDEVQLGEFGTIKRKPSDKKYDCAICHDRDHHAKICVVWNHPAWPEELRKAREERIRAAREAEKEARAANQQLASRGGTPSRGGRGGHFGGQYSAPYGPPPHPYFQNGGNIDFYGYGPPPAFENGGRGGSRGHSTRGRGRRGRGF